MQTEPQPGADAKELKGAPQAPLRVPTEPLTPDAPTLTDIVTPTKKTLGPWSVLRNRNYALLFWGQLISAAGTQMQVVAVAWQVYLLTHSAVALGLIGLVQAIPRLIFSLVGGLFADTFDRRKLLLVIELLLAAMSGVLAICTLLHIINMVIIYVV